MRFSRRGGAFPHMFDDLVEQAGEGHLWEFKVIPMFAQNEASGFLLIPEPDFGTSWFHGVAYK